MSNINIEDLLGSIKGAFNKTTGGGMFKDILKLEKNKTYIVRLVPNVSDPENSLFPFTFYGWTSEATGNYIEFLNPEVFGKPNPLKKIGYEEWSKVKDLDDKHKDKIKAKKLWKRFACLANVYVISDETNSDNNGKVKMIRMGKQLYDIVEDAFQGEEKEEFGVRIFDLSPNGCNLKIRVTENEGGFANYQKSKFMPPSEIEELDSDDKIKEVWDKVFDLSTVFPVKSYDAIKELVAVHYFNEEFTNESSSKRSDQDEDSEDTEYPDSDENDEEDDVSYDEPDPETKRKSVEKRKDSPSKKEPKKEPKKPSREKDEDENSDEIDIDAYLESLEID